MNKKRIPYNRKEVGNRIKSERLKLGLTQKQLAEKVDRATNYIADIERGSCGMSAEIMISISQSLDISLDYMVFGKKQKITYPLLK